MLVKDLSNSFNPVQKIKKEKVEKSKYIKGKKHKQTKATDIPKAVKIAVWERDKHRCIFCQKLVPIECACCHFKKRSQGGLGIEENVFTGCQDCHTEQDNGLNSKLYDSIARNYLKRIYGQTWNEKDLIYKKY